MTGSRSHSVLVPLLLAIFLSGQISAFAVICPMPDMHMSMSMEDAVKSGEMALEDRLPTAASDHGLSTVECERVCGYCISSTVPLGMAAILSEMPIALIHESMSHQFFDSAALDNPLRPPILA